MYDVVCMMYLCMHALLRERERERERERAVRGLYLCVHALMYLCMHACMFAWMSDASTYGLLGLV